MDDYPGLTDTYDDSYGYTQAQDTVDVYFTLWEIILYIVIGIIAVIVAYQGGKNVGAKSYKATS